jgi:signal transduction histidine kinase
MVFISSRLAWLLFGFSVLLLVGVTFAGDRATTLYAKSEWWVSHTHEVEAQIALLRASIGGASSTRFQYRITGDTVTLERYQRNAGAVAATLAKLKELTADNPEQQKTLEEMAPIIDKRMALITESLNRSAGAQASPEERAHLDEEARVSDLLAPSLLAMQKEESDLLVVRTAASQRSYILLRSALLGALGCVLLMLGFVFRSLLLQLELRTKAEASVRRLSSHILRTQDLERRRLARDLHDGLGQLFVGISMELGQVSRVPGMPEGATKNLREMVEQGLTETRTISHLLHPPMLEDFGFEQTIRWYADGFAKRSGVQVDLSIPENFGRLPGDVELVLFRVIQEALTNIHKHSGSSRAEVKVRKDGDRVETVIRDYGKGIAPALLESIDEGVSGLGVGLGGMRERVREFDGGFAILSDGQGTTVTAWVPLHREVEAENGGSSTAPGVKVETAGTAREKEKGDGLMTRGMGWETA